MSQRPNAYVVYGKAFTYPPRGTAEHYSGRDEAFKQARKYGADLLATMAQQKGAPLSHREELSGQLDAAPDLRPLAQRVREDAIYTPQQTTNPDRNPWATHLENLSRKTAHTPADRGALERRRAMAQKSYDEWEAQREAVRVIERRNADPAILNMRQHAEYAYTYTRNDSTATADEARERKRLLDLANSDSSTPSEYFGAADAASKRWYARLDASAADKKTAVADAKEEHKEARDTAKEARAVDFAADDPPIGTP